MRTTLGQMRLVTVPWHFNFRGCSALCSAASESEAMNLHKNHLYTGLVHGKAPRALTKFKSSPVSKEELLIQRYPEDFAPRSSWPLTIQ
jgi:hypothetical protein